MLNLNNLRQTDAHPLKSIFTSYNRAQIAKQLGIGGTYLSNILQGHLQPGPELARNMQKLAEQIQEAEKMEKVS